MPEILTNRERRRLLAVWILTVIGALFWIGAIAAAPWLRARGSPLADLLYLVFEPTCHQINSRCFIVWGYPLAVCTRCLGIDFGFLASALLYPAIRGFRRPIVPRTKLFLAVSAPIVVDTLGNLLGFWSTSDWTRFALGAAWGLFLPWYFITGVWELFSCIGGKKTHRIDP